jgi:hypothetical protein
MKSRVSLGNIDMSVICGGLQINGMTTEQIITRLEKGKDGFSLDFIKFGKERAARLRKEGRSSTAGNYDTAINALVNIFAGMLLMFRKSQVFS